MPLIDRTFSDIITFTRASAATMFDSTGTLVYAPMNAIRNSSASGASAPSTLPTNWGAVQNGGTGVTSTVATGTEDGISYLDINISGTPSGSGSYQITFEPPATISALSGQTWTNSAFLKLSAGSFTNVGAIRFTTAEWTSAPAFIQNNQSVLPFPTNAALSTQRAAASVTLSGVTTASIVPSITLTITAGQAISLTLRIGLPQLELGSVARTAIATSGTAYQGPRFDYDPVTLAARGMLIEEQRTNLLLQSEDLSTTWSLGDGTVTANSWTPPTGVATGDTYTIGTIATTPSQNVTVVSSTTYTLSFYYNKTLTTAAFFRLRFGINGGSVSAWFDTANATFGALNAQLSGGAAVDVGNNIYRVSLQIAYGASDGGSRSVAIAGVTANSGTTADTGNDLAIWGAQLEAGAFPTSYIPTTTAAATRAADVASVNTLAPWYNATEGTLYAQANLISSSYSGGVLLDIGAGGAFGTTEYIAWDGTLWALRPNIAPLNVISTVTTTSTAKVAAGLKVNDSVISANSLIGVTDTSCGIASSPTTLSIGKGGWLGSANYFNGYLRRIGYYKRRLSNAQLQAITQ